MSEHGWDGDAGLFELISRRLTTSVIGDILDQLGHRHQFLPQAIRPLKRYGLVTGRAMPVLEADVYDYQEPFGKMFAALDSMRDGEIYLAAGGSRNYAFFGELMSVAAAARGARGAVLHGFHRDTDMLEASDFPVYSLGAFGQDQGVRGRVIDFRTEIEVGGVTVSPGDLVVADNDGVVVVPQRVEVEAVHAALEKVSVESDVRDALRAGATTQEVFKRFGVL